MSYRSPGARASYNGQSSLQAATKRSQSVEINVAANSGRTWDWVGKLGIRDILSHDDSEASIEMPVDVAMEEPRSGVVRLRTKSVRTSGTYRA